MSEHEEEVDCCGCACKAHFKVKSFTAGGAPITHDSGDIDLLESYETPQLYWAAGSLKIGKIKVSLIHAAVGNCEYDSNDDCVEKDPCYATAKIEITKDDMPGRLYLKASDTDTLEGCDIKTAVPKQGAGDPPLPTFEIDKDNPGEVTIDGTDGTSCGCYGEFKFDLWWDELTGDPAAIVGDLTEITVRVGCQCCYDCGINEEEESPAE